MTVFPLLLSFALHVGGPDLPIGPPDRDWAKTGDAFKTMLASESLLPKLEIQNASDGVVISSEIEDDRPTGALTSPRFTIERGYIAFRIGGGNYPGKTCLNLIVGGKVVKTATGRRSDYLKPLSWNVRKFIGQKAQIQVVDLASGDWGHINVARLVQTDTPEVKPMPEAPLYQESLRPQFHFTARWFENRTIQPGMRQEGWVNDLNGLIYYEGEYHLFAQRWNRCWIHAVSKDLVHWHELEPAFWEEKQDVGVQSGTCVVDYENTSGLATDKAHPAMVAFWSRNDNESQCIHYSLDHGRTWKFYEKNPIMVYPERDPKVFWYAPGKHWVMMLYGHEQYHIFTSSNLLDWKDEHHPLPDSFECPDFFELPLDGNPANKKWVLIQGNGNYSVGTFNGVEFKEETPRFPCDVGPNFYATQTWENVQTGDGRRIQTAWMRGSDFPEMPFSQQISFPCELTLHSTPDGPRIHREPIPEIAKLHSERQSWNDRALKDGEEFSLASAGETFHIKAEVSIPQGSEITFNIRGVPVTLTSTTAVSGNPPVAVMGQVNTIEILVDRASIELFVNHGEVSSTRFVLPKENGLSVKAGKGAVTIHSLEVYRLKSIW